MTDLRKKYTLEQCLLELEKAREEIQRLNPKRQHGRSGKEYDDPYDELQRLRNNIASRISRAGRRELEKKQEAHFRTTWGIQAEDADEYGIRPVDERRYIRCFKSGYIDAPVSRKYIKMMSGISLKQMYILQERTGLIPTPRITMEEANIDEKRRYETGDIY